MKKCILVTLSLSLGLLGGLSGIGNTANAASTHKGLPHVLRSTKWKAKSHYINTRDDYEASEIHFHKTSVSEEWSGGVDPFSASKLRYRYVGHHKYKLYGRQYGNEPAGGAPWSSEIKVYSKHKIYYKDLSYTSSYAKKYIDSFYYRK